MRPPLVSGDGWVNGIVQALTLMARAATCDPGRKLLKCLELQGRSLKRVLSRRQFLFGRLAYMSSIAGEGGCVS